MHSVGRTAAGHPKGRSEAQEPRSGLTRRRPSDTPPALHQTDRTIREICPPVARNNPGNSRSNNLRNNNWIDLFDPPSRIDEKRAAWDEARRRVREHPELKTVVLDRHTGVTLWQSDPDIPARYEVLAVDETVFYALETNLPLPGDVLSAHKEKDDAWTAFYEAVKNPVGDDIIVLRDTVPTETVIASSDEDLYRTDAA